jgi:hypothetical protein
VRVLSILFCFVFAASGAIAQSQPQNWTPQAIQIIGQSASSRTEFSFDRSMLVMASKPDQDDPDLRRVIAGVDGISVHRFRFMAAGAYDPHLLDSMRQEYSTAGWQHVTVTHNRHDGPAGTDIWFHFANNTIRNFALIFTGPNQVSFVTVSGSISPLDLLHLAGHFGIPKIHGGIVVPANGQQLAPAPNGGY